MIFVINSYAGYEHKGENKLLSPHETLELASSLEHESVEGVVPFNGQTQIGPITDVNEDDRKEGFVAEFTQGGVLVDPKTGKATVVAYTIDVAGKDDSGEIYFSDRDEVRHSEEITLDPTNRSSAPEKADGEEATDETPENIASIAGIAMPATKKLLVVQMIPELSQN
jgi:hypothetical protein